MMTWKKQFVIILVQGDINFIVSLYFTADAQLKNARASRRANLVSVIEKERSFGPLSTTLSGKGQLFAVRLTPLS